MSNESIVEMRWIPVSDTPPKDGSYILCRTLIVAGSTTRATVAGSFVDGRWYIWNESSAEWDIPETESTTAFSGKVTHYMPLPAPPDESEEWPHRARPGDMPLEDLYKKLWPDESEAGS